MRITRIWILALLALGAGCRSRTEPARDTAAGSTAAPAHGSAPVGPADPAPAFTDIDPGLDALRARFQEDDGMVRVIMLVAPT